MRSLLSVSEWTPHAPCCRRRSPVFMPMVCFECCRFPLSPSTSFPLPGRGRGLRRCWRALPALGWICARWKVSTARLFHPPNGQISTGAVSSCATAAMRSPVNRLLCQPYKGTGDIPCHRCAGGCHRRGRCRLHPGVFRPGQGNGCGNAGKRRRQTDQSPPQRFQGPENQRSAIRLAAASTVRRDHPPATSSRGAGRSSFSKRLG